MNNYIYMTIYYVYYIACLIIINIPFIATNDANKESVVESNPLPLDELVVVSDDVATGLY